MTSVQNWLKLPDASRLLSGVDSILELVVHDEHLRELVFLGSEQLTRLSELRLGAAQRRVDLVEPECRRRDRVCVAVICVSRCPMIAVSAASWFCAAAICALSEAISAWPG